MNEFDKDFWLYPDKYLPIDALGEQRLRWFQDRFYFLYLKSVLPTFDRAHALMVERGNISPRNRFGEMHGDRYMYVIPHEDLKIIVYQEQSCKYIYIRGEYDIHCRGLHYDMNYPNWRKVQRKGITIEKFAKQGFVHTCPEDWSQRFNAFSYGDGRDAGYVFSVNCMMPALEPRNRMDHSSPDTNHAIECISMWEEYINNPEELE